MRYTGTPQSKAAVSYQDKANPDRKKRYRRAFELRLEGKTYREIGALLGGISSNRAMQLVWRGSLIQRGDE